MLSISLWLFGIWNKLLNICSFKSLESKANLLLPSFLLVITIGFMKQSSSLLSNFHSNFLVSSKSKWTVLPLIWIALNGEWKCVTLLSNGRFPNLLKSSLKLLYMLRVVFEWTLGLQDSRKDTVFNRSNGCFCAFSIPIRGKLSFPKMFR